MPMPSGTPVTGQVMLVLEGPPGAGKTTLLGALVPALGGRCVHFSEPNVKLIEPAGPVHTAVATQTLWYLRHERARLGVLAALADAAAGVPGNIPGYGLEVPELVLCDRNHLGVLAYCYATGAPDALPYTRAYDYHQRHIAPQLPTDLRTVILLVSVPTSLKRRGGHAADPRWRQWYDPARLERLRRFYVEQAAGLCPRPPLIIDTDHLDRGAVLRLLRAELAAAGIRPPADSDAGIDIPGEGEGEARPRPGVDAIFADAYQQAGGVAVLGGPVTPAFDYRGGRMQMFELGCLHTTATAGQVRVWDPLAVLAAPAIPEIATGTA